MTCQDAERWVSAGLPPRKVLARWHSAKGWTGSTRCCQTATSESLPGWKLRWNSWCVFLPPILNQMYHISYSQSSSEQSEKRRPKTKHKTVKDLICLVKAAINVLSRLMNLDSLVSQRPWPFGPATKTVCLWVSWTSHTKRPPMPHPSKVVARGLLPHQMVVFGISCSIQNHYVLNKTLNAIQEHSPTHI